MGDAIRSAAGQAWPPFVLVAGLLLVGAVVEADGLFAALGARIEQLPGGPVALVWTLLGLEAIVTAVLNLDTAAVFMTPIVLHAARQRACDLRPFLYGALFMANGASLLLPGSNLTNLIVLAHEPLTGAEFAAWMALPWVAVVLVTAGFVALVFRLDRERGAPATVPPLRFGLGAAATVVATVLMLALHNAALPVLAVGLAAVALRRLHPAIGVHILGALFVLAVALGTLARRWHGPAALLGHVGGVGDAVAGAAASVLVNNLPAATLLAARKPAHPLPLLVGLNLGPNLLFTGSLSAYLWYQAARGAGVRPSLRLSFLLGVALVPLTMAAALGALALADPGAF